MASSYYNTPRLVVTMGSYTCRAGFSCENKPRSVIRTAISTCKTPGDKPVKYYGNEAIHRQPHLNLFIEHGIITNFDFWVDFIQHVFYNELKVAPEEHAVMLSEIPIGPKANREKTTQILFETFNIGALYVKLDMVLAMIASGRVTGTVVNSGASVTHVVPIFQGYGLPHAIMRLDLGGDDVTRQLATLLSERCYNVTSLADREAVNKMKHELAYVSQDIEGELAQGSSSREETYSLPDGRVVKIGTEKYRCTEIIMNPSLIGRESPGITNNIFSSLMKSDVDIRKLLYGNVLLTGGNSMIKGMDTRIATDLKTLAPKRLPVDIISLPDKDLLPWFGGSILSSLPDLGWVTKGEYDESGPSIIHRKCF